MLTFTINGEKITITVQPGNVFGIYRDGHFITYIHYKDGWKNFDPKNTTPQQDVDEYAAWVVSMRDAGEL